MYRNDVPQKEKRSVTKNVTLNMSKREPEAQEVMFVLPGQISIIEQQVHIDENEEMGIRIMN